MQEATACEALVSRQIDRTFEGATMRGGLIVAEVATIDRFTFQPGHGVWFSLVYASEDEEPRDNYDDGSRGFFGGIIEITANSLYLIGGVLCVRVEDDSFMPVENFGDDETDLAACRWFSSRGEAETHLQEMRRRLTQNGLDDLDA